MICKYDTKSQRKAIYKIKVSQLKRETHPQLTPQACKVRLIQGFCEYVCELVTGVNMAQVNVTLLIVITKKVKAHINVFGLGV
jgi:uncharacterized protein YdeI (YjbR/CyaY-like superfamily)